MRTTISMDDDVAAAVERHRREHDLGLSAAVNQLVRRGLQHQAAARPFVQETSPMHARIDVTNIAEALELIEGPAAR